MGGVGQVGGVGGARRWRARAGWIVHGEPDSSYNCKWLILGTAQKKLYSTPVFPMPAYLSYRDTALRHAALHGAALLHCIAQLCTARLCNAGELQRCSVVWRSAMWGATRL